MTFHFGMFQSRSRSTLHLPVGSRTSDKRMGRRSIEYVRWRKKKINYTASFRIRRQRCWYRNSWWLVQTVFYYTHIRNLIIIKGTSESACFFLGVRFYIIAYAYNWIFLLEEEKKHVLTYRILLFNFVVLW